MKSHTTVALALLAVLFLAVLCCIVGTVSAGNFTRPTVDPSETIANVSTLAYNTIIDSIGGNTSPVNATEARPNWTQFLGATINPFTAQMGYLAYVLIFAIPFVLMWLMHGDLVPAAVAGIIIGGFGLTFLPAEYSLLAGVFVAIAIVAVVYSLLKERM
jgi:hypothetical protein